ncbi:MAG: NAD(P)/FAD-dependent oxidoreductase, partial [Candidatus Nealsonbacteria bacterium]|nr:NAD(P)/FAD-dependent oxidoreductase [Candidatus Nealsonbacteria bacterium]
LGVEAGMVTSGGIALEDVDDKTMRSKSIANLFFAGEIINVHGATGGFNLQQCWSTGRLSGASASVNIK